MEKEIVVQDPRDVKINMQDIMHQHQVRWTFLTSVGRIDLRYLSKEGHDRVIRSIVMQDPQYETLAVRWDYLDKILSHPGGDQDKARFLEEMKRITMYLMRYSRDFYYPCFLEPLIQNSEEFDALMSALSDDEYHRLMGILTLLASTIKAKDVNANVLSLCKEWGIPISTDINSENMTVHQANLLETASRINAQKNIEMIREMVQNG